MHVYLSRWVLHKREGIEAYVADGSQDLDRSSALDLTPPGGIRERATNPGLCLLTYPESFGRIAETANIIYLTDDPATDKAESMRRVLNSKLPMSLAGGKSLADYLAQWLIDEADSARDTRMNPLRPSRRRGQFEIVLGGERIWTMPHIAGGANVTETFPTDNASWGGTNGEILTDQDQDWLWLNGDAGSVSGGTATFMSDPDARLEVDADSDDYSVTAPITKDNDNDGGVEVRVPGGTYPFERDGYQALVSGTVRLRIFRLDNGVQTELDNAGVDANPNYPEELYLEADGSSITSTWATLTGTATDSTYSGASNRRSNINAEGDNTGTGFQIHGYTLADLGGGGGDPKKRRHSLTLTGVG